MDAQVQLAQKHGLIYAPCLFFMTRHMAMAQPELSAKVCEELGKRYASVPGIMFYIFDDGAYTTPFDEFRSWSKLCVEALARSGRRYLVNAEMDRTATWLQRYATSALAFPTGGFYPPFIGDPALELLADMRMAGRGFHTSEFGVYASGARPGDYRSQLGARTEVHLGFARRRLQLLSAGTPHVLCPRRSLYLELDVERSAADHLPVGHR